MINEENLNKIYESVIKGAELTTKELKSCGFNSKDLASLIESGTLERVRRGYYSFKSIDKLYYYGEKLLSKSDYYKANLCFEKCLELDSAHLGACFQLFLRSIKNKNYEKAFEYFDIINDTTSEDYNADNNYYLYLLSMITTLPEKHRQHAKFLRLDDIKVDAQNSRYNDTKARNMIRISALNQRFALASKQLYYLNKKQGNCCAQDSIIRALLSQALEEQKRMKSHIIELATEKQFEELIKCLETLKEQHNLSLADEYTLILAKDITEIKKSGTISEQQISSTDNLFTAIKGKNYELALSLSRKYSSKNNLEENRNIIHLMLTEIQSLIDKIKQSLPSATEKETQTIEPVIVEKEEQKQAIESKISTESSTSSSSFAEIVNYLMKNDLNNAFRTLRNYLDSIEKRQYEFLIIDLIKISLLESDIAFTKPMIALTYIARENFEFNISEYIQDFYQALAQNKFDKARIYLDIISNSNNLGQTCVLTEGLETVLNNIEKPLNHPKDNEPLNKVEQSIEKVQESSTSISFEPNIVEQTPSNNPEVISSEPSVEANPMPQKEETINTSEIVQAEIEHYDDSEFINQNLETVYEKGILLLDPMNGERRKEIHKLVKSIPDVVSFSIGSNNSRQVVLRFKSLDENINVKELLKIGNNAYNNGDYDTCINSFRQLLNLKEPKSFVYAKLGLAYMKKFDRETAIAYLTVADELSKKDNVDLDFTELIASLKGLIAPEDRKPLVKMSISDFENDLNNYYGIEQVEHIAELISSGKTLDDACLSVGLDEEQKNIVTLILAKESYAQEDYTMGNQYLKKVERAKNKSKFVKSLLNEIRKNKMFYKNRVEEGQKRLSLSSKAITSN